MREEGQMNTSCEVQSKCVMRENVHTYARVGMIAPMCEYTRGHDRAYVCVPISAYTRGYERDYVCIHV